MLTNREMYSQIVGELKANSIDSWISPKLILSKATSILGDFLKKGNDAETNLYKLQEGWTELECFPLQEVPVSECNLGIGDCKKLMRTIDKIPDTYSGRFGNIIKQVANINFSNFYEPTTPRGYKNIQNRQDKSRKNYYFFVNNHIYIPVKGDIAAPEQIRIEAYFMKPWEVKALNNKNKPCIDCKTECLKPLDFPFISPEYLINPVKSEVVRQLANVYLKTPIDAYPNQNPLQIQPLQPK